MNKVTVHRYVSFEDKFEDVEIELSDCPFCGGKADFLIKDWDNKVDEYKVYCEKCEVRQAYYTNNPEKAAEEWNKRV